MAKFIFTGKIAFFKSFLSDALSGPKEKILSFAQKFSNYFGDPFKLSSGGCNSPYYEKKQAKVHSSMKRLTFFNKIVSSTSS